MRILLVAITLVCAGCVVKDDIYHQEPREHVVVEGYGPEYEVRDRHHHRHHRDYVEEEFVD